MWREKRGMLYTSVLLCKTSVAGVALSKAIQTCKNLQAAFARSHGFRHCSCLTRKNKSPPAHSLCAKGECLAVPPFLYACLSRISQGSFNVDRTGRLTVKFSLPVQKLPSIPAFLQIPLSLSGMLSLAVLWYVLLFLTTFFFFYYSLYHSRGFFICQEGVFISPSIYAQISSLPCLVSAENGIIISPPVCTPRPLTDQL